MIFFDLAINRCVRMNVNATFFYKIHWYIVKIFNPPIAHLTYVRATAIAEINAFEIQLPDLQSSMVTRRLKKQLETRIRKFQRMLITSMTPQDDTPMRKIVAIHVERCLGLRHQSLVRFAVRSMESFNNTSIVWQQTHCWISCHGN